MRHLRSASSSRLPGPYFPAQLPGKVYRIGYIVVASPAEQSHLTKAFEDGMRDAGYEEGRNVVYERRFARGDPGHLPALAADLVKRAPGVILTGANPVIGVVKQATATIPVVMGIGRDPVGAGFIASHARPGGNITGLAADPVPEVLGKDLEIFREVLPRAQRVALLRNPVPPSADTYRRVAQNAAGRLGLTMQVVEVRARDELDAAFEAMVEVKTESYDKLVLSPGAKSIRPPLPGIDLPGIFQLRTVPDARAIREWIEKGSEFLAGMYRYSGFQTVRPKVRAVVVGGGFIGLETAENLVHRGFEVTLVEMADQVLAPLDAEMAHVVEGHLERHGVRLALNDGVAAFERADGGALRVRTKSGKEFPADVVVLALGVRPDIELAQSAGLQIGERGGIRVDEQMRTSNPDIFAVGDAVEVKDVVTGESSLVALAGPANRQGRIAADVIAGRNSRFRGTQGTTIIGLFGATTAWTGVGEKTLKRRGDADYEKVYLYPNSHAGYYPGARPIALKVIFRKSDGRVLGAQGLGEDGVDKRISTIAMAIQMGATVYDLEEAELCYAPQFGSAKDPVNFAGMVAAGVLRDDMPVGHWDGVDGAFMLDVRGPTELAVEDVPGAVNIPLPQLRARLGELPRDREILTICRSGGRAYFAARILQQNGFKARVLSGGMLSRSHTQLLTS